MKPSVHSLQVKILWDISYPPWPRDLQSPLGARSHFQEATDVYKRLLVEATGLGGSDALMAQNHGKSSCAKNTI